MPKCGKSLGWEGPGEYVLALSHTRDGGDVFQVTPLPRTPGFSGWTPEREEEWSKYRADGEDHRYKMIYKATPPTLRQLELLTKEFHP